MAAMVSDHNLPEWLRVCELARWLVTGKERPVSGTDYREAVETEREKLIMAIEAGEINVSTFANGEITAWGNHRLDEPVPGAMPIALVVSEHRAATMLGYCVSPLIVCINPAMRIGGGGPHTKVSVCQFEQGYCDLVALAKELAETEPGWGGSKTFVGSPQGVSTSLSTSAILSAVHKHSFSQLCSWCGKQSYNELHGCSFCGGPDAILSDGTYYAPTSGWRR
jgi:hypothetical protein